MPAGTIALGTAITSLVPALGVASPFLVGLATQTAIGLALYAISGKGKNLSGGYSVTATGSTLDHQIIYGKTKVAGALVYQATTGTNNRYLHRVLVFAGHEIDAFEEIYINGYKVTGWGTGSGETGEGNVDTIDDTDSTKYDGFVEVYKHYGTSGQSADSNLVSRVSEWTTSHRLRGLAYLYVRFDYDASVFPNGIPEVKALVRGKKVYDPRDDTTAWSDNPALCIRDYLARDEYGLGEPTQNIDGEVTISNAADVCDEEISSGVKRYTCNGAFTTDAPPVDILETLLTSCAGTLWYAQGEWRLKAGEYVAPTLTLDEDDFIGPISVSTRHSRRDNFNGVRGTYKNASTGQFTDYTPQQSAAAVTADGGLESYSDLDLLFTDTEEEAIRIATIALEQNRQQITVTADFGLRAFELQIGDTVAITNSRFGWSSKVFEVEGWSFQVREDLTIPVNMVLRETRSEVYDTSLSTD